MYNQWYIFGLRNFSRDGDTRETIHGCLTERSLETTSASWNTFPLTYVAQ